MKYFIYITFVVVASFFIYDITQRNKEVYENSNASDSLIQSKIAYYEDELKNKHKQIEAIEKEAKELSVKYNAERTKIASLLKISDKDVKGQVILSSNLKDGTLDRYLTTDTIVKRDTFYIYKTYTFPPNLFRDSIIVTSYNKRINFFTSKSYIDVYNTNKNIEISPILQYEIKVKKKRFGIGINAGYGITTQGLAPYIGFGLNYNLIEF